MTVASVPVDIITLSNLVKAARLEFSISLHAYFAIWYIVINTMARKPQLGPASDPELLILTSLAESAKHGYAIMQDIEHFSGTKLGPGTLYTAITRLVEKGMIKPEVPADRQRPYRITKQGLGVLSTQLRDMQTVVKIGIKRLAFL